MCPILPIYNFPLKWCVNNDPGCQKCVSMGLMRIYFLFNPLVHGGAFVVGGGGPLRGGDILKKWGGPRFFKIHLILYLCTQSDLKMIWKYLCW